MPEEILHRNADPLKVKLIKGQRESYGWEITVEGKDRVDILREIYQLDQVLRQQYFWNTKGSGQTIEASKEDK